jgi:WD40 repeat protein
LRITNPLFLQWNSFCLAHTLQGHDSMKNHLFLRSLSMLILLSWNQTIYAGAAETCGQALTQIADRKAPKNIVQELVLLTRGILGSSSRMHDQTRSDWGPTIVKDLLTQKRIEIERKLGKKAANEIFALVHAQLNLAMTDIEFKKVKAAEKTNQDIFVLHPHPVKILKGHKNGVVWVSYSPDGKTLLAASYDYTAKLWDVGTGEVLLNFAGEHGHSNYVLSARFSPDGKKVVTTGLDSTVKLWDAKTGEWLLDLPLPKNKVAIVRSAAFSPDGSRLVTPSQDGKANVWSAVTGDLLMTLEETTAEPAKPLTSSLFINDGRAIVTTSLDQTIKVWKVASQELLFELAGEHQHHKPVLFAALSRDQKRILTGALDSTAKVWNAQTGAWIMDLWGETSEQRRGVTSGEFSHNGQMIVTTSDDEIVRLWDAASGKFLREFPPIVSDKTSPQFAGFSADDTHVAISYADGTVRIWQLFQKLEATPSAPTL